MHVSDINHTVSVFVSDIDALMTQRTHVLHVEPLPQTPSVEQMPAAGHPRAPATHSALTDGTHVSVDLDVTLRRFSQHLDPPPCFPPLHKRPPPLPSLHPNVAVRVHAHHGGTDQPTRLEQHDPRPIAKQEDAEEKLDGAAC